MVKIEKNRKKQFELKKMKINEINRKHRLIRKKLLKLEGKIEEEKMVKTEKIVKMEKIKKKI